MLIPVNQRNKLDRKYITDLTDEVYKLSIPSEAKRAFIRYTKTNDKEEIQKLRCQVIYHIFNSEIAFEMLRKQEGNIDAWYRAMREILDPAVTLMSENDQKKIVALLTREKAQIDGKETSRTLFERLMDYM